jgi:hypothetical protein
MNIARCCGSHSVIFLQGQNWLYTQPQPVKKAAKGREYPVPAHMVSLRLCGVTFDQFRAAFDRYAAEHLDSDAGKAAVRTLSMPA